MSTDTKPRRGRPAKSETVSDELPEIDPRESWRPRKLEPNGPKCIQCGRPTERSTEVLKAYKLVALRCMGCKNACIEGDDPNFVYDLATAASGLILSRAAIVYEKKYPTHIPPSADPSGLHEMMFAEDERWNSETL